MNWRKQIQEHIRDANEQATWIVVRVASDSHRERVEANLHVPDVGTAFDRIERDISNARRIWSENR